MPPAILSKAFALSMLMTLLLSITRPLARIIQQNLQVHFDPIENSCNKWRIAISPQGSSGILFTKKQLNSDETLSIDGQQIPWRDNAKYLR